MSESALIGGRLVDVTSPDGVLRITSPSDREDVLGEIPFAVAMASEPCSASSLTCTALSAPIDSALRIDSVARSGPTVRMVTSPPWASLSCRPSSMANSSM